MHGSSSFADGGAVLMEVQSVGGTQLVFGGYVPVTNWERQSLLGFLSCSCGDLLWFSELWLGVLLLLDAACITFTRL